jgi:hypothetical protein
VADEEFEEEVVDGLPVVSEGGVLEEPAAPQMLVPARQVAALAATGFVAGAATVAVVSRRRAHKAAKRRKKGVAAFGEIMSSNSFLVDVHLLRRD